MRFCSHHEMLRALERAAVRANLPLKYTRGFNPHPILALPAPRPVGVASRQEMLVIALAEPVEADELLTRLGNQVPRGLHLSHAEPLPARGTPTPARADYELPLAEDQAPKVRSRLAALEEEPSWPVQRWTSPKGRRRGPRVARTIDIRPMVAHLAIEDGRLRWSAVPSGDTWARPGDVLGLLALDAPGALADVVRTAVEYRHPRVAHFSTDESAGAAEAPPPSHDKTTTVNTHAQENAD